MNSRYRSSLVQYALLTSAMSGGLCVAWGVGSANWHEEPLAGFSGIASAPLAVIAAGLLSIATHDVYRRIERLPYVILAQIAVVAVSIAGGVAMLMLMA